MNDSPATTLPDAQEQPHHKLRERWAPLGLVLAGGFWNFFVSPMRETVDEVPWLTYYYFYAASGVLVVQPMLCAVWGAWSTEAWIWRLPIGLAACFFLSLTAVANGAVGSMLVANLSIHLLFVVLLTFMRWRFHFVLTARDSPNGESSPRVTFGLKYLFLWMTVAAVLTGLGRILTFGTQNWGWGITMLFAFSLLLVPPAWLLAYLLRSASLRLRDVMAILLLIPIAAVISQAVLWFEFSARSFWREMYLPCSLISLGAVVAVAVAATVLRFAGYRIYRIHPS